MRKPYSLPEKDCERLKRSEMTAVRMLLAALSTAAFAVFYIVVYRVTAGVYFSLVSSGETGRTA